MTRGLADTSYFIADEQGRGGSPAGLPDELAVSVITIGELRAGVLAATDPRTTARRLRTLDIAEMLEPIPIDEHVADAWAELRVTLLGHDLRMGVNDSWIVATAIAHDLPLVTQAEDLLAVPGLQTIRY